MELNEIKTNGAPAAIGPFSQAIISGGYIFISGQLPIDPVTGNFPGESISKQAKQSLENIKSILVQAGLDMTHVVKTTVFLADMEDFAAMNEVYGQYFSTPYPARAAFQVAKLPKGAKVEIEAVAVVH